MTPVAYRVLSGGLVPCEPSPIPEAQFDRAANVAYLRLSHSKVKATRPLADDVNLDVAADGSPVGIELLDVADTELLDVADLVPLTTEQQSKVLAIVAIFDRAEAGQIDRREALRLARRAWGLPIRARSAECGTRSGYNAHRRLGTPYCGPCRDAATESQRAYRARRAGEGS